MRSRPRRNAAQALLPALQAVRLPDGFPVKRGAKSVEQSVGER